MNLLLFTQVYPDEEGVKTLRSSSVCHYWTKEWKKQGHNVVVIYCYPNYHLIFHWIAKRCPQFIAQFTNATITNRQKFGCKYNKDDVEVFKIPIYKPFPKIKYDDDVINNVVCKVIDYLGKIDFKPDLILGHFDNPILEIAGKCKDKLKIPFAFVLHGYANDIKRLYPNNYREIIDKVDVWGYRSLAIKKDFDRHYGEKDKSFICYSGIPECYIAKKVQINEKKKGKVCFAGALMKRKYPEKVIIALLPFLKKNLFSLCYIGEGALAKSIKRIALTEKVSNRVELLGNIPREAVMKELSSSEYFIMVSRHETFGMVYLEAMAQGCITIASEKEGFDGIIRHGVNGFLCKAGDSKALYQLICVIEKMSDNQKQEIIMNAIETAKDMTESIIAKKYVDDVLACLNIW